MRDPLEAFRLWDGKEIGPDEDLPPGIYGRVHVDTPLHFAGAHITSTLIGPNRDRPALILKMVVRALGATVADEEQPPPYHIIEGLIEADIAEELGEALQIGAQRSRADLQTFGSLPENGTHA